MLLTLTMASIRRFDVLWSLEIRSLYGPGLVLSPSPRSGDRLDSAFEEQCFRRKLLDGVVEMVKEFIGRPS